MNIIGQETSAPINSEPEAFTMKSNEKFYRDFDFSIPVVVIRCIEDSYIGLGVVRSLGRLGVPVYTVVPERKAPCAFSRYCNPYVVQIFVKKRLKTKY